MSRSLSGIETLLRVAEAASLAFERHRLRRRIEQHQRDILKHPLASYRRMYATCLFIAIEALMTDLDHEE